MFIGASKRVVTVEWASYLVMAFIAVSLALLAPGVADVPGWVIFAVWVAVQLLLYRRFCGRL